MRQVLPGLNKAGPLQYKSTLTTHQNVNETGLPVLNKAGPLQYKTTLTTHPTVNDTSVTRA